MKVCARMRMNEVGSGGSHGRVLSVGPRREADFGTQRSEQWSSAIRAMALMDNCIPVVNHPEEPYCKVSSTS